MSERKRPSEGAILRRSSSEYTTGVDCDFLTLKVTFSARIPLFFVNFAAIL